jgi:hypothetical protein
MATTRGRYMKDYVAAVRRLPPSKQEAVLRGLESVVEQVERAANSEWLPIETNLALTDAIFRELGSEEADTFYQHWLRRQVGTPLWSSLVATALKLFGLDPGGVAKWVPKAFELMYRDYGTFGVERIGPSHAVLHLKEMPAELVHSFNWQRSVCSGMYALFFVTRVKGTAQIDHVDVEHRWMRIGLRW